MGEIQELDFVDTYTPDKQNPIEKKGDTPTNDKGKKLSNYLSQKEETEILLLDMLRAEQISRKDYDDFITKRQHAYKEFLAELTKENE